MGADLPHLPDISPVLWGGGGQSTKKVVGCIYIFLRKLYSK